MPKKIKKDDFPFRPKDIVLCALFHKRLCISVGEHVEFYADKEIIQNLIYCMEEAIKKNEDILDQYNNKKIEIYYNSDDEIDDLGPSCKISVEDFSIQRLTTKEFNKILEGFKEFTKWAEEDAKKMPLSKDFQPFMFRVK